MNYAAIIFLALTLLWARARDKCLVNPVTVTSLVWLFILAGYEIIDHGLYPLSARFYAAFLTWIIPFQLACGAMIRVGRAPNICHAAHPATPLITNKCLILFVSLCAAGALCMDYQQVMQYDPTTNFIAGSKEFSADIKHEEGISAYSPVYLNLYRVGQTSCLLCLVYLLRRSRFRFRKMFYVLTILFCLIGGNKGVILNFFIGLIGILCLTNRLNIRALIWYILFLFLAVYAIQFFRDGKELNMIKVLYIYLFSSLPAFDTYILHSSSDFTTYFTGDLVFKNVPLLGRLMADGYNPVNVNFFNYQMALVPLPTNVYTMMAGYWASWKWTGLLIGGGLHGLFWGYIYGRAQRTEAYKVLYAMHLYMLVFYFFHDFLMEHIGTMFRMAVLLFLLLYNPMFEHIRLKR